MPKDKPLDRFADLWINVTFLESVRKLSITQTEIFMIMTQLLLFAIKSMRIWCFSEQITLNTLHVYLVFPSCFESPPQMS